MTVETSEKAAKFADAAKGTKYEVAVAEYPAKPGKAASDAHYQGEGLGQSATANGHPVEMKSTVHKDVTTVKIPPVPNEGEKLWKMPSSKQPTKPSLMERSKGHGVKIMQLLGWHASGYRG